MRTDEGEAHLRSINVTVTGVATDTPLLCVDSGHQIRGAFESPSRVIFMIGDDVPPWGAVIQYGGTQTERFVVPPAGALEGPVLSYRPLVQRLHAADDGLVTADGARVVLGLTTDFRLWQMALNGEDTTPIRQQRRAVGAQGYRVFGTCVNLFRFDPRQYASYYDDLTHFARLLAADGEYLQFTAIADGQLLPGLDLRTHWARCCDALADEPNVVVCELVNEYFKNGVDPSRFAKPSRAPLVSVGSFVDGDYPPAPWGDVSTFHPSRSWKWWFTVAATAQEIRKDARGAGKPVWIGEPMGAAASPRGDRACDPALFEKLGVSIGVYAAGGVFHADGGLCSTPWSDVEAACAAAFFRGLHR